MALNGGSQKNNFELKLKGGGGVTKKIPPNFAVTAFVIIANSLPKCQKPAFLILRKFKFSQGSMPLDPPTLLCIKKAIILTHYHAKKHTKSNVSLVIFGINTTSDISKLLYVISRAVRRVKFETILKYHEWYLCQISRTNHAIICLYYYPQKVCNFHM